MTGLLVVVGVGLANSRVFSGICLIVPSLMLQGFSWYPAGVRKGLLPRAPPAPYSELGAVFVVCFHPLKHQS